MFTAEKQDRWNVHCGGGDKMKECSLMRNRKERMLIGEEKRKKVYSTSLMRKCKENRQLKYTAPWKRKNTGEKKNRLLKKERN